MNINDFANCNSSNDIEQLKTATGAMAELLKLFYDSCLAAGFDYDEALTLVVEYMKAVFVQNNPNF